MKVLLTVFTLFCFQLTFSQAYTGQGDVKLQIGANLQNNGTGIMGSLDFGVGENISLGVASSYLLGIDKITNEDGDEEPFAKFEDRFDLRLRFNANLGNVINVDENFDLYPGLYASFKNFGGHLGARYFFHQRFWGFYRSKRTYFQIQHRYFNARGKTAQSGFGKYWGFVQYLSK